MVGCHLTHYDKRQNKGKRDRKKERLGNNGMLAFELSFLLKISSVRVLNKFAHEDVCT